ncbi:secreted RxLR effector protein 161-like [Silene latifolia]|uniref:secreted RxLR effector protein 161-like n=1 Tax=Silene latifolia TaxID=37657 RepID=UPI003D775401
MHHCKPVATPLAINDHISKSDVNQKSDTRLYRSIVGSLLYLTTTRPYLMFAASLLSSFMTEPSDINTRIAKRILRYLRGTSNFGVMFESSVEPKLTTYSDIDWAGTIDDMKSTSGYAFTLGFGIFSWMSKKQGVVTQSTAEAEYVAASATVNQTIWLRKILADMGHTQENSTEVLVDSKSAITIS